MTNDSSEYFQQSEAGSRPKILIIEDDRETALLYQDYLREKYETTITTSGKAALEEATAQIDIVLLDRNLPRMRGKDVLLELKSRDDFNARTIVLTSEDPDEEILQLGIDGYRVKPVYQDGLVKIIEIVAKRDQIYQSLEEMFQQKAKLSVLNRLGKQGSPEYSELQTQVEEMRNEINQLLSEVESGYKIKQR